MKVRVVQTDGTTKKCSCGCTLFRKSTRTKKTHLTNTTWKEHQYYCYVCESCEKIERQTIYNSTVRNVRNPEDYLKSGAVLT